jgi:hypothetical protein
VALLPSRGCPASLAVAGAQVPGKPAATQSSSFWMSLGVDRAIGGGGMGFSGSFMRAMATSMTRAEGSLFDGPMRSP